MAHMVSTSSTAQQRALCLSNRYQQTGGFCIEKCSLSVPLVTHVKQSALCLVMLRMEYSTALCVNCVLIAWKIKTAISGLGLLRWPDQLSQNCKPIYNRSITDLVLFDWILFDRRFHRLLSLWSLKLLLSIALGISILL